MIHANKLLYFPFFSRLVRIQGSFRHSKGTDNTTVMAGGKRKATTQTSKKAAKQSKPEPQKDNDAKSAGDCIVKDPSTTNVNNRNPHFDFPLKKERINEPSFYDKPCLELSKELLGKLLVRRVGSTERVSGLIVETEAYTGPDDVASHSYKGKTERNKAMFMDPGTAYVYFIYGSYSCMNISSRGDGAAVLLRALAPVEGINTMRSLRYKKPTAKPPKMKDLCNGPSKFCMALDITKPVINTLDMKISDEIWLEEGIDVQDSDIVISTRIGIDGAGKEAAGKPFRFYLRDNVFVSKRDKKAEQLFKE